MKRGMSKFFSILLIICMILSMVPVAALAATPATLYLKPNSNWLSDGARFAAYFFGGSGDIWVSMADTNGDGFYEAAVPAGYSSVIFCRMNGSNSTNTWDNKWNQTGDLSIPTNGNNCYTVADGTWDNGGGSWSTLSTDVEEVELDYYLFGYINGANYACEEDADNIGTYKFVDGKLTATFDCDSYVAVKTSDNSKWYMTSGWVGEVSSATLYNTNSISEVNKLYVPGGVKVTFTLTVNSNNTLTLSYAVDSSTCKHAYHNTDGVCRGCGTLVGHTFSNGSCSVCGATCDHSWSNGKCKNCGTTCSHNWDGGSCGTCGMTCSHSWSNGTCKNCGSTCYHTWSGYSCTTCKLTREFYLFGYINGANYGCEDDSDNMGTYKFSSGKLTVNFTSDSYIGIKTTDNLSWYMLKSYSDATSATFYNTSTGASEKLFVPGGMSVTFTLTVNSNDTLKLSYSIDTCAHTSHGTDGKCTACGSTVSHSWSSGKCSVCGLTCSHPSHSTAGKCTTCGKAVSHTYSNGSCSVCGKACSHSWSSGKCKTCGLSCTHSYSNGKCSTCGLTCSHSWSDGVCKTCGYACTHSYSGGKCTTCGSIEAVTDYYLFGYINGANYACEDDWDNLGSYKFVSGKLTATFDCDSYVAIKTGDNANWYMAKSYISGNSGTFYNTSTGASEKMFVPGGVKVTFTLTEGAEDTISLTYSVDSGSCAHLTHSTSGKCNACGATVSHSYSGGSCTVCGSVCTHSYSGNTCTICGATKAQNAVTLHFVDSIGWHNVVVYPWIISGDTATPIDCQWPGVAMNKAADGSYYLDLNYTPKSGQSLGLIFNNFAGAQTVDLTIDYATLSANGEVWVKPNSYTNSEGKYECATATSSAGLFISPVVNGNKVTFRYANSYASSVSVAGSFNSWGGTKMTKSNGVWSVTMDLTPGVYEYKFIVDGEWITDPNNGVVGGYDGNSIVVVKTPTSPAAGKITVKFHFYRESGDYTGWDIWAWGNTLEGASYTWTDDTANKGKVATITLDGASNNYLQYIVRKSDWSDQEFSYTRSVDLTNVSSGTIHFFLNSGSADGSKILDNDVVMGAKPTYANLDYESGKIWVKTPLPVTNSFTVTDAYGNASDISVTDVTLNDWGYSLSLSRQMKAHEPYNYRVKCGTMMDISTEGMFYSNQFAADYTYHGSDLGATWTKTKTTFKVWAPTALNVTVQIYSSGNYGADDWIKSVTMTRGDLGVWTGSSSGNLNGKYYLYTVDFGSYTTDAVDPYAKSAGVNGDRGMILDMSSTNPTGWENDVSPNRGMNYTDAIIYEMHVREMTIDSSSGVKDEWKGKYLGMTQTGTNYQGRSTALDHLKELGITHVQLMPVYDFSSNDEYHLTDWQQYAWGYDPKHYNLPEGSYATDPYNGEVRVNEFKQMVQTFHSNGINVVMDVVYNHTYSGGDWCYNKIVPVYFSRFWGKDNWSNGSGCGNDIATERSMARNYIVDSILYWVEEYHIDGFRFDYAGLIDTQTMNDIMNTVHAKYPYVIFYGEGWNKDGSTAVEDNHTLANMGNAWAVGSLAFYNDTFRNSIAGDNGHSWGFATGDTGKADQIASCFRASNGWSSSPSQTINYVSAHDNFTLIDKIIISRNGAYWEEMVKMNNLSAAIYMMAQGIPYIYSGEEVLREKKNEDGYRIDNAHGTNDYVNKIRWNDLVDKDYAQVTDDYYAGLVAFRKNHAALRNNNGADAWGYTSYYKINDQCIMFYISGYPNYECSDGIIIIYNASNNTQWVNLGDYGVPWGYWQATVHGMTAGTSPLWGVDVGGYGTGGIMVEGISATMLVLGDLIHEESVYNNQNYSCSHSSHTTSGLCTTCGVELSHSYSGNSCTVCGRSKTAPETMTIYFDNSQYNWSGVYAYTWAEAGGKTKEYTGTWPGSQMTEVGNGIYALTISTNATYIMFNDALGNQTGRVNLPSASSSALQYNPVTEQWVAYTAPVYNYYVTGTMNNWALTNSGYLMQSSGTEYTLTMTLTKGSYEFKVTDGTWDNTWPAENYALNLTVKSEVTITFNPKTGSVDVNINPLESACTHPSHNTSGVCTSCGVAVGHSYTAATCTSAKTCTACGATSGSALGHSYTSKVTTAATCTKAGTKTYTCSTCGNTYTESIAATGHSYSSKVTAATCTTAGYTTYTCSTCGDSYTGNTTAATGHNYVSGVCKNCGDGCSHSYSSKVTTAATCTTAGVKTYTCSKCSTSYTESIAATGHSYSSNVVAPTCTTAGYTTYTCSTCGNSYNGNTVSATGHSYSNGSCSVCGAADPNGSTSTTDYYLFGYINGANYACEDDWENVGVYKFTNGRLSVTFTQDSYIGVKTADNGTWYLTDGWQGMDVTSVTLYNSNKLGQNADKMYVPGNVSLTLILQENSDGTLTLSYSTGSNTGCSHSYTSKVTTAATCTTAGVKTYTCSKCGDSYTQTIAATGHSYSNGTCTGCGATQSSTSTDYYLFGYINGANYACEDDWANLGIYKFVDGKLTATFNVDSYVAVKAGDNSSWYMTKSYVSGSSATFYHTNTGAEEKMFVPGGVEVTFTLTVNSDDTLSLSYTTKTVSVTKPTLTLTYPSLSFEDEILYNVYYTVDDTSSVEEMGLATFSTRDSNGTVATAQEIIPGYANSGSTYMVQSNGIPAKNLGDALYFKVYAKLTNGTYVYSEVAGYNAPAYAKTVLGDANSSAKAKALVVAMLNYGAAAQTYFGYKTNSLMNSFLTSSQKALVSSYSSSMVADVVKASSSKVGSFVMNGGYSNIFPTVSFEGAFSINYYFTPSKTVDSKLTFYYWDSATYNSVSKLTAQNATGVITMSQDGSNWGAAVEDIAAKSMDDTIYVAAIYTSGGVSYPTGVIAYSLGQYCKTVAANGEAFGAATAVYGYYAKAYFA